MYLTGFVSRSLVVNKACQTSTAKVSETCLVGEWIRGFTVGSQRRRGRLTTRYPRPERIFEIEANKRLHDFPEQFKRQVRKVGHDENAKTRNRCWRELWNLTMFGGE